MSASESKVAELERAQKLRREKNRIAQQKHREKRKKDIEKKTKDVAKMMTILQKVKLAVTLNDIGQIKELVKSPTIPLPVESSSVSTSREKTPYIDVEKLFPAADDSSSSQPSVEVEATRTVENAVVEQELAQPSYPKDDSSSLITQNSLDTQPSLSAQSSLGTQSNLGTQNGLATQSFFQPTMDPFFWNMANMFPSFQMPYFDTQSPLHLLPPIAMPNPWETPWEGYPAIMAGM
ncbi:hypothetical protein X797_011224 [Metarhizium robertsii]|uniref:BZIP domain-containing protein n=1 Tax=Metarhizium robertsii TaxID=568076 RepID=A0A0A1UMW5_9HYPO|nr:hypothetical protein X797_011224 [Metarhizium robertsii]